jgi:ceramide glucosyltransferase
LPVVLTNTLGFLACLSAVLTVWQWLVGLRFPLHQRLNDVGFTPAVTLLKPLKGCDSQTERCLRSWFEQDYGGAVQLLFGVASEDDPVCGVVRRLIAAYPKADAELIICHQALGPNAKVSSLVQLQARAAHDVIVISDADVWVPGDLLASVVAPLKDPGVGLVNCLYQLANPVTKAMEWEAVAVNADFWTQVLQSQSLSPLKFALGAVMATTRAQMTAIGGFDVLLDHLADDYQLGHKIALNGARVVLCPVVVECWSEPMTWREVWAHQLRWSRTIRVCQPVPFFFSLLSNGTWWPLVWLASDPELLPLTASAIFCAWRIVTAHSNQQRLTRQPVSWSTAWLVPAKDLLGVALWSLAFLGREVVWRGRRYHVQPSGRLVPI